MAVEFLGKVDEIPAGSRSGIWVTAFKNEWSKNPGDIYHYTGASSSTAANLRRDYGVDASTQTVDGVVHLYVVWRPEKADEIRAKYADKKAKSKGNGTSPAPPPAAVKAAK